MPRKRRQVKKQPAEKMEVDQTDDTYEVEQLKKMVGHLNSLLVLVKLIRSNFESGGKNLESLITALDEKFNA